MAGIQNFTKTGKALGFRQRPVFPNNGGDPAPIRARLSSGGGITGSRVKVTNPRASKIAGQRRTAGLGMGGADGIPIN